MVAGGKPTRLPALSHRASDWRPTAGSDLQKLKVIRNMRRDLYETKVRARKFKLMDKVSNSVYVAGSLEDALGPAQDSLFSASRELTTEPSVDATELPKPSKSKRAQRKQAVF